MTVTLTDNALFRQQCYINGRWCDADDGATFTVTNPATDESLGTSPRMGEAETRQAIDAAHGAFPAWRDLP
ncbi:MAG TPA: succinate-semialdehyde dehydrogenase (NADP(+)), partial [Alcanivorax sp.]|nr:succinate-semialdehyde dehydrogenase (NADP(+)) [Alcanivorax sp.]